MGRQIYKDEYREATTSLVTEASKIILNAFNEGYSLGVEHAKSVLGEKDEN